MHFYFIFFLKHAITMVFLFCRFIRMFVRTWIAVPVRAKKEVAERAHFGPRRASASAGDIRVSVLEFQRNSKDSLMTSSDFL